MSNYVDPLQINTAFVHDPSPSPNWPTLD